MFITERDIEILKFINEFGYCEMPQIEKRFGLKKPRSYKVIKRLIERGLLLHDFVLHNKHGIYRVTKQGAELTDLPMLKYVSLGSYNHQITVVNVYLDLMIRFPGASWVSERKLRREKFIEEGFRKPKHVADGILILPCGKRIAIEVELTMKNKHRLEKIIYDHVCDFDIQEAWYFCEKNTLPKIIKCIEPNFNVKVFNLSN